MLGKDEATERDVIVGIESQVRKSSLVPVISDFLFPDVQHILASCRS